MVSLSHSPDSAQHRRGTVPDEPPAVPVRRRYLYRLDVTYPPGADPSQPDYDPYWWPENIGRPSATERDPESGEWIPITPRWVWPRLRVFLGRAAAEHRADLFRHAGATVEVFLDSAVEW